MKKTSLSVVLAAAMAAIPLLAGAAETKTASKRAPMAAASGTVDAGTKAAIDKRMQEFVAAWNNHDAKAMAAVWATNCDLINPFGMKASGRAEIEKLFEGEQGGVMKTTTYTVSSESLRKIAGGAVVMDIDSVINGMMDPAGKALPPFTHHVTMIYVHEGGQWRATVVRAFQLLPPPGK
jgi:uncharacterized protein (TIGR02246 family)